MALLSMWGLPSRRIPPRGSRTVSESRKRRLLHGPVARRQPLFPYLMGKEQLNKECLTE